MARLLGLEPKAYGLEGRCSILLSYRRSNRKVLPAKKFGYEAGGPAHGG